MQEIVYSLISKLQREVYRDNKISLYNKDGIGLNFAYQNGCHELLDKGEDAFYYSVFTKQEQPFDSDVEDQKRLVQSEPSDAGSNHGEVVGDNEPDFG